MNRFFSNRMRVIMCLFVFVLGVVIVFSGTWAGAPSPSGAGAAFTRASTAFKNRRALEAYEKRNTEVTPWAEDSAPPNPANAALLYYQAFLLRPEPNETLGGKIHTLPYGTEPDRQVRTYLGHCLPIIEIVEKASRMEGCIWDLWPERQPIVIALRKEILPLAEVVLGDAVTLAADGHYRVALEQCLTVRRFARHLSGVLYSAPLFPLSMSSDQRALCTIQHVLGVMPPDAEVLTWFRGQLAAVQGAQAHFATIFQAFVHAQLYDIRTNPDRLERERNLVVKEAEGEQAKEKVRNLTDEQFVSRARKGIQNLIDRIFRIVDSEMPYDRKRSEIHRIINELNDAVGTDPVDKAIMNHVGLSTINIDGWTSYYWLPYEAQHLAQTNGIKAAVEVYLVLAQTGRLPEKLPEYLPKDPFTGRDFVYEITDKGFALRCQG